MFYENLLEYNYISFIFGFTFGTKSKINNE